MNKLLLVLSIIIFIDFISSASAKNKSKKQQAEELLNEKVIDPAKRAAERIPSKDEIKRKIKENAEYYTPSNLRKGQVPEKYHNSKEWAKNKMDEAKCTAKDCARYGNHSNARNCQQKNHSCQRNNSCHENNEERVRGEENQRRMAEEERRREKEEEEEERNKNSKSRSTLGKLEDFIFRRDVPEEEEEKAKA
ncbi:hypothetical protein NEFER03_0942 [Nematocida sp. LUAm3]|nr:hypothetical protein NEFER03_0942 [Nematocida sp. LUAm3]KAI5174960.1 hypothetical protein NEFER02_1060 [Nematocida sp. LUAm2]KAI5177441.1 hypothetical protein NEFER01_0691 [Nematocida sp. LUAm1]